MRREMLLPAAIGVVIAVLAAAIVLKVNLGSHMVLDGSFQSVRTVAIDGASAMAVDFRLSNPASYPFVVRTVSLIAEIGGKPVEGAVAADVDAKQLIDYYPAIGPKYNDTLRAKDRINPGQTMDRMLAARFEVPEAKLQARTRLTLRIEEIDGQITEIVEKKR
ncbi:MAG: hypothetical protein IT166_22045 [Bryobacterales bacterium]|nr:hypothetical protein [Bryobacterales bacterium]